MRLSVAVLASAIAFAACDKAATPAATPETRPNALPNGATAMPGAMTAVGDSQVLASILAVNSGEVEQGNTALPKLANAEAKDFAALMVKEHGEAVATLGKLGTEQHIAPSDDAQSTSLKDESAKVVTKLGGDPAGAAYDRAYIQSQVDGHTKALTLIDEKLLPSAQNAELKSTITELRGHVQHHLTKAQEILAKLPS